MGLGPDDYQKKKKERNNRENINYLKENVKVVININETKLQSYP